MKRLFIFIFVLALVVPPSLAHPPAAKGQTPAAEVNDDKDNLWYVVDLETTPLSRGILEAYENLPNKPGPPKHTKKDPKELAKGGKKTGWLSQNEIVVEYDRPNQKCRKNDPECGDSWQEAKVKVKPEKGKPGWEDAVMVPASMNENRGSGGAKNLSSGFFSSYNDDQDCVDTVTGRQYAAGDCFQGDPQDHLLVETLVPSSDPEFCQHREDESVKYVREECEDRKFTTLIEAIDEDGPEDPDVDGDGNLSDLPNGKNDDQDCVDNQGNHYAGTDCDADDRFALIDEDLVDIHGNPVPVNNDEDCQDSGGAHLFGQDCTDADGDLKPGFTWLYDEDPPGESGVPEDELESCRSLFVGLGVGAEFSESEDFDAGTGECNLDKAVAKGINKKSERAYGKHVFKEDCAPGDTACMDKQDWEKAFTASEKVVEFTYPDLNGKTRAYHVELLVDDGENKKKCSTPLKVPEDKHATPNNCNEEDKSYFEVTCDGLACTFTAAASGDDLAYEWTLGNIPQGAQSKYSGKDAYEKAKEPRTVSVTEVMLVRCPDGWEYEEDSTSPNPNDAKKVRCRKAIPGQTVGGQGELAAAATTLGLEADQSHLLSPSAKAMMGFTFAPPVIEWGWKIEEEVCIFGWCFEVFYARVGYEFDLGVGFRLPVKMKVDVPDTSWPDDVWADTGYSLSTSLTPLDFTTEDYVQFCKEHKLDEEWYISDCERFAFPNFLNPEDGDEFVAYYEIFAGIIVRVLGIPLITWGIDSSFDLAQACTMYNGLEYVKSAMDPEVLIKLAQFMADYATDPDASAFYQFLKDESILCGSYMTPVGYEGGDEQDPRGFPFLGPSIMPSYEIPADCTKAYIEGKVVTIKGKPRPICTNMILGTAGANLGIGLELEPRTLTDVIGGTLRASKDARVEGNSGDPLLSKEIQWEWPVGHEDLESVPRTDQVLYDNYDLTWSLENDKGIIEVDDLTYYLDLRVTLYANLEFGGILSPIPDLARFKLFEISYSGITGTEGIPIPQHPGTEPLQLSVDVKNHGVDLSGGPDPVSVPENGGPFEGWYDLTVTNVGSLPGTFANWRADLTNIPQEPGSGYVYDFNKDQDGDGQEDEDWKDNTNNDGDCIDLLGTHFAGDDCQDGGGNLKQGLFWLIDEDPPGGEWTGEFPVSSPTGSVGPYDHVVLDDALVVHPFQHSMTKSGLYPVRVWADSVEGKGRSDSWDKLFPNYYGPFTPTDDHRESRWDAYDVVFVKIEKFYKPDVYIDPEAASVKPGVPVDYAGTFQNAGNDIDTITVVTEVVDSNQGGCTLTTLGTQPDCPYRAVPTWLPESWMAGAFGGSYGPLPGGAAGDPAHVLVTAPRDWAGMEDTSYELVVTGLSAADTNATDMVTVLFTVQATKESMTRYIGLEIDELIQEIEAANAQGVQTCGLQPISIHPIKQQNDRALELILAGQQKQASNALSAGARIVEGALLHALAGCQKVPADLSADWQMRGEAMLNDFILASESTVTSAP